MEMDKLTNCPVCNTSWDGGSILDTFIKQREEGVKMWQGMTNEQIQGYIEEFYSLPYKWSKLIGIELPITHPNYYDGISCWQCPECKTTWDRFKSEVVE